MNCRVTLTVFGFIFVSSVSLAQEVNPLDSIEVSVTEEMVAAAQAILESTRTGVPQQGDSMFNRILGSDGGTNAVEKMGGYVREELLSLPLNDKARRDWSYWPRPRVGLALGQMTAEQRMMVHDLLNSFMTPAGYLKVVHIMQLEELLHDRENLGLERGNEKYWLAFFGTPSMDEPWGWRFEGHHVSLNISVAPGGGVRVTPTFFGADPAEIRVGALAGFRPHAGIEDLGRELVLALSDVDREIAVLSEEAPGDIFATQFAALPDDWETWHQTLQPEGIAVADLNSEQRHIVQRILDEVVTTYRPEISSAYLKTIDIDELSFAWMGSVQRRRAHYYRLQGSDFVFEFDNVQNDANHIHSVWRSKSGDFGNDLLLEHYQTSHR